MRAVWEGLVREGLGGGSPFEAPWGDVPAMMRSCATTPALLARFDGLNSAKRYANRVKPFTFLLSATVDRFEWPANRSVHSNGFHLIAPYSPNPLDWLKSDWIDLHSNEYFRIR